MDITDQIPIPGFEEDIIRKSKLETAEARRMLTDLAEALEMPDDDFIKLLSRAWIKRRNAKAKRYGWFNDEMEGKRNVED